MLVIGYVYSRWGFLSTFWLYIYIYIYIYFLNLNRINFGQLSTLRGAVTIMINSSKISIHRFIATTLFRVVKEWPHSSGNIHEYELKSYYYWSLYLTEVMKTWLQWVSTGPMLSASLVPRLWPSPPRTMSDCLRLPLSSTTIMTIILSRGLIQMARAN